MLGVQWTQRLTICAALALGGVALWGWLDREVQTVRLLGVVTDAERTEVQTVVASLLEQQPAGLLSVDIADLRLRILALSWPRTVSIRRYYPGTLEIGISGQTVIARWGEDEYLSSSGEVVQTPRSDQQLPQLKSVYASPIATLELYQGLSRLLMAERLRIQSLEQNALGEWRLQIGEKLRVNLGAQDVTSKAQLFLAAYRSTLKNELADLAYVDARYPNGVAVRYEDLRFDGTELANAQPFPPVGEQASRKGSRHHGF